MKKIDKFTKEEVEQIFAESKSQDSVARKIGYNPCSGGTHATLKRYVEENNIDISHFTGQGQNKGNVDLTRFRKGNHVKNLRDSLLLLRPHMCECCKNTEWMSRPIPLEVHHIDGDHLNNELDNLQLLCPNCHAQTDNQCGRNVGRYKAVSDEEFIEALRCSTSIGEALKKVGINYIAKSQYEKARELMLENNIEFPKRKTLQKEKKERRKRKIKYCSKCGKVLSSRTKGDLCSECLKFNSYNTRTDLPNKEQLEKDIYTMPFEGVGRKYKVTGNTVRKWCKYYGLPCRKSDINQTLNDT